jgi:hypothetical protein
MKGLDAFGDAWQLGGYTKCLIWGFATVLDIQVL